MLETEQNLLKKEEERLNMLVANRWWATAHHRGMIALGLFGSSAILASGGSLALDILPRWVDISMAIGGLLTGPSAIYQLPTTRRWMEDAREKAEVQKVKIEIIKGN